MRKVDIGLVIGIIAAMMVSSGAHASARAQQKSVQSGKTQVVAKAAGREITLSELRAEMARLQLSFADPEAERVALESIVNRVLLSKAARKASLHRRPEAIAVMHAAQDQALADLYLGVAAQPPEPTRAEIDDFIAANPALFSQRRIYEFLVLTVGTQNFDEARHTPLFDEASDFAAYERALVDEGAPYAINGAVQPSTAFPQAIREQLAVYDVNDNIVLRGAAQTQIMKILSTKVEPTEESSWGPFARRVLMEEASAKRATDLVDRLKREGDVAYFRQSAAPAPAAATKMGESRTARDNGQ